MPHPDLRPGTLWPAVVRQTAHALHCGALCPIETTTSVIEDGGVRFLVRQVSSLARKEAAGGSGSGRSNPFLPCDPDLFVADISDTHLALLNKFNVIDHHLLVVTRRFAPQQALLTVADFAALLACLAEYPSLGFYNSGPVAGASQPHKHLQTVPLPLAADMPALPIDPLLAAVRKDAGPVGTVPGLGFAHAFAALDLPSVPAGEAALAACERYRMLLAAAGVEVVDIDGERCPSAPYNLLVMARGLLLVPRRAACVEGVAVNALGFAGSLFVRDEAQMHTIGRLGPMAILREAAGTAA